MINTRNTYFDNAKFMLILLVVFGHAISPYRINNNAVLSLYHFIFIFHMPAFIILTGYLSKNFKKKGYYIKIITKLFLPFLIFQTLYTFYYNILYQNLSFSLQYIIPRWALWFLVSLICWKLVLPLFARLPMWLGLSLSMGLSLGIGYFNGLGRVLSIKRMLFFFPFFLLGYYLSKKEKPFKNLINPVTKMFSVIIILLALLGSYYFLQDPVYTDILYGTNTYANYFEILFRVGQYFISIIVSFAFMVLVPSRPLIFSEIGKYSLYIYLLHGFILKWFFTTNYAKAIHTLYDFILLASIAVIITLLTGNRFIECTIIKLKQFIKILTYKLTKNYKLPSYTIGREPSYNLSPYTFNLYYFLIK